MRALCEFGGRRDERSPPFGKRAWHAERGFGVESMVRRLVLACLRIAHPQQESFRRFMLAWRSRPDAVGAAAFAGYCAATAIHGRNARLLVAGGA